MPFRGSQFTLAPELRPTPVGGDGPMVLIAGPCVLESLEHARRICGVVAALCDQLGIGYIFKSSFDKANRTSLSSFRGPGLERGLDWLAQIREREGVPVTTDIHLPEQAGPAAQVVDLLQIPAFLCRQTDLLVAAARTGRPVNLKKGQFLSPREIFPAAHKLRDCGAGGLLITERGTTFGYNDLVVDMRSIHEIRSSGLAICLDATHSVQSPGGLGGSTGGRRDLAPPLARAGAAVGLDALFLEVHDDPDRAPSDGPNMLPLELLPMLLREVVAIDRLLKGSI